MLYLPLMQHQIMQLQQKQSGFTLVELMMLLAILGIVTSFAIPSYTGFMTENRLSNQNTSLMLDFIFARGEAATRGNRVTVCQSSDGASCSGAGWGAGRIIFVDNGTTGSIDGTDEILRVSDGISSQDTMAGSTADIYVAYKPSGVPNTNLSITTCKSGYKGAKVTIYPSGRIVKDRVGSCA